MVAKKHERQKGSRISFPLMETKNISKMDKGEKWSGQNIKNREKEVETFEFLREIIFWSIVGSQVEA